MIEFNGECSNKCAEFIIVLLKRLILIIIAIIAIPLNIPTVYLTITYSKLCLLWFIIYIVLFLVIIFMKVPPSKYYKLVPSKVVINEDIMSIENEEFYFSRKCCDVKVVIDYGEWYFIKFYFPHKCQHFICEKALITQGTIEEFEKMFEGKIKRKYK